MVDADDAILSADGVRLETGHLLRLRHLVQSGRDGVRGLTTLPGGFVVRRRGRGLEVDDIRVFSQGDDMRHLDRNTTARTGVPHVRTFCDEREKTLMLLVDFRPAMFWGSRRALLSVAAGELAALAGWRAVDSGARVGLIALSAGEPLVLRPRGRDRAMVSICGGLAAAHATALRDLATVRKPRSLSLLSSLESLLPLVPTGADVLMISGFDGLSGPGAAGFEGGLAALRRRLSLLALVVADRFELAPPAGAYPFVDSSGQRRTARIGPVPPVAEDPRVTLLNRLGIPALPADAGAGPEFALDLLEALDGHRR